MPLKRSFFMSPQTSLGGILSTVGLGIMGAKMAIGVDPPTTVLWIGYISMLLGTALTGIAARDNNVTSREAGAE